MMYDVTCPVCGEEITFDEDTLTEGSIICPQCGKSLSSTSTARMRRRDGRRGRGISRSHPLELAGLMPKHLRNAR